MMIGVGTATQIIIGLLLSLSIVSGQEIAGLEVVDDITGKSIKTKVGKILDIPSIGVGYKFGLRIKLKENTRFSDTFANVTVQVLFGSGFVGDTDTPITVTTPFIVKSTDSTGPYSLTEYIQTGGNQKSIKIKIYRGDELLDDHVTTFYVLHPRSIVDDLVSRKSTSLLTSQGQTIHINDGYVINLSKEFSSPLFELSILSSFSGKVYPDEVNYYFEYTDSGEIMKLASTDYATSQQFRPLDYFQLPGVKIVTIEAIVNGMVQFSEIIDFELTYGVMGRTRSVHKSVPTSINNVVGSGGSVGSIGGAGGIGNLRSTCRNEDDECASYGDAGYHMNEPNEYDGCTTKCIKKALIQQYLRQGWECGPCAMTVVTKQDVMQPNL